MQAETATEFVTLRSRSERLSRPSGIEGAGDLPWGTHFCQFYETVDDLLDIVAPYFAAGLGANERCLWIASPPLTVAAAKARLSLLVPDLEADLAGRRIDIVSCEEWYLRTGEMNGEQLLGDWRAFYDAALRDGFDGLRANGNAFEHDAGDWPLIMAYEKGLGALHDSHRMLTLCSYSLRMIGAAEIVEVIARHEFALIRRGGRWETIKSLDYERARKALRQSEEHFHLLAQGAPDSAILTLDPQGRIVAWSAAAARITGWLHDEILGRRLSILHPDAQDDALPDSVSEHGIVKRQDALRRRDGSVFPAEERIAALRDDADNLYGYAVMITDLSEKSRAEQERRTGEARLRAIVEGAVDAIVIIDEKGVIQALNSAATRLFGRAAGEAIGLSVDILFSEPLRDARLAPLHADETAPADADPERLGRRKDGSAFPLELSISETAEDGDRLFVLFLRDLTDRRRAEAQMSKLRADRLDLMAQMAASVAHEINQPLSAIATYLSAARRVLRRGAAEPTDLEAILDSAVAQVTRAAQIISHLRGFVTRAEPDKTMQRLHDIIRDACAFTDMARSNVKVVTTLDLEAADDCVIVDRIQIRQVLVNLKRNAIEAMHGAEKRELLISTRLIEGGMIRTDIVDSGAGLSEDVVNVLFEPFITTKTHGLGVGLPVSRAIVEAHYGTLWAEQNPGGGARLSFTLPLADDRLEEPSDGA
ncbi:MAG TPA: PAS domain S-box protein [Methylosinus sp.]|jgi:two-component system sensor kinase FixL|uniref:PAS domain S-box protein n=1 Tax=Methylosinus sp. TaxID=427 RepID=UPI002F926B83